MSRWAKDFVHPATSWTGAMTIPRELGLVQVNGEIVLTQQSICQPTYVIDEQVPTTGVVGLTGFVKVGYDADKKTIFINEFHAPFEPADNRVQLKVVVDRSSVELFTADGTRSITLASFPEPGETRIFHAWQND
jgi:sucrose-6-phosphate hydrolase SacC (GH32 family)